VCASDNLAALPADWVYEHFGLTVPISVVGRLWLIMSLAELGRFAEAAKHEAEASLLAESSEHLFTIAFTHFAASMLHFLKGDWAKARSRAERWTAMLQTGNVALQSSWAAAGSAWALAQIGEASEALDRIRRAEELLECETASGIVAFRGWAYSAVGRACLLLNRVDKARHLADRAVEVSGHHPGFAAHALYLLAEIASHPDHFDVERGATNYREALALARRRGMRPLIAHCYLGLGKLYYRIGETERARESLLAAATMYREMEMDYWLNQGEADMINAGVVGSSVRAAPKSSVSGGIQSP
jgi:tetratricopeptide (TPR) repeat protein